MSFMSDRIFVDANILVYARDLSAGDRHAKASAVVESLWGRILVMKPMEYK
jgi:predicted nucleic acid-binding protein